MKKSSFIAIVGIGLGLITNGHAQPAMPSMAPSSQVVALDANRDNKITTDTIKAGQDTFLVKETTAAVQEAPGTTPQMGFTGADGKTYVPIKMADLDALDTDKNSVLTADELQKSSSPILTARALEGTNQYVAERPFAEGVKTIDLLTKPGEKSPSMITTHGMDDSSMSGGINRTDS